MCVSVYNGNEYVSIRTNTDLIDFQCRLEGRVFTAVGVHKEIRFAHKAPYTLADKITTLLSVLTHAAITFLRQVGIFTSQQIFFFKILPAFGLLHGRLCAQVYIS